MLGVSFKALGSVCHHIPLSDFGFNKRAEHCLMRANIWDAQGIVDSWEKIDRLRGVGKDTAMEIKSKFFIWYCRRVEEMDVIDKLVSSIALVHEVQS